ncbi:SPOR domain-containing protein [Allosphingosinicella vermicomposti]|uniref:SPOR domain-containing protein n=1 Tax=Allosphingosinicella vermicomposti TaxID=614671 RepID=UPI00131A5B98|nr:SPOR domain-containing protein [Allosphingosinicella vermicomposti]
MNVTVRIAVSALAIALTTVGCQTSGDQMGIAALTRGPAKEQSEASRLYEKAQQAAQKGDIAKALTLMEEAVALSPNDAAYRMALAEAYLRSGRYVAAERTFSDTVILNPDNMHAGLYLALTRAALGKDLAALSALEKMEGRAKASDLGLAYALVGDAPRGVTILEEEARSFDADSRVRQNLALAYALAGDWRKAQTVAMQDLSPSEATARIQKWAAMARPGTDGRVIAFLGFDPVDDSGQPTRLALAAPVQDDTAYAEMRPVDAPQMSAEAEPVAMAMPALAPAAIEAAPTAPQPVFIPASAAMPAAPLSPAIAPRPLPALSSGNYVVQIGAFSSRAQAEKAWKSAERRYGFTADRQMITTVIAPEGKGAFHRLAVQGFATAGEANRACRAVKAKGGDCFVRALGGDSQKIAMR